MRLIWTKNTSILSKSIRWLFNEPVSHFAIVFDNSLVFHSNLLGVHLAWFNYFKNKNDIIYSKEIILDIENEEKFYRKIVDKYYGKNYDFKAFFYFAYRGLLKKFFNIPVPDKNTFQDNDEFLCTGLASLFFDTSIDYEIITPYQLYLLLK